MHISKKFRTGILSISMILAIAVITTFCFFIIIFHQLLPLLPTIPQMLGFQGTKIYLVLFQNNEELRPGGGFIGSYGLATIQNGHLSSFTVHNTYDPDGQLHKHIEPYYIERRYIQVHLYMRDSNFDVDFEKSAQKVATMLRLETGQQVDGVIAIDVSFMKNILNVLSPVYVWQYKTIVTPDNFFLLTETKADKYSFSGSTQKQDFLRALFEGVKLKFQSHPILYGIRILQTMLSQVPQKHLLITMHDKYVQNILTHQGFSSTLWDPRKKTAGTINDFLGINEANIGANKANYFLKRSIEHRTTIAASGKVSEMVRITYTNTTNSEAWPSGVYKNYVRIILPDQTILNTITIDNKKQTIIPAVTNFRLYEAPGFILPKGLEVDKNQELGKTIYGFLIPVGLQTTKTVTISYTLAEKVNTNTPLTYNLFVFKQPGMDNDPYELTLYSPHGNIVKQVQTTLSTDKHIIITVP